MLQDNKDENKCNIEYLQPRELMQESANLLYRSPVFLSHPNRLNRVNNNFRYFN